MILCLRCLDCAGNLFDGLEEYTGRQKHATSLYINIPRASMLEQRRERMGVTKEQVESALTSKLTPPHLEVIDTSGGCGASFAIEIVSDKFEGKRLLERHRLVNGALEEEMKQIHALSIKKAITPTQWKQELDSQNTSAAS